MASARCGIDLQEIPAASLLQPWVSEFLVSESVLEVICKPCYNEALSYGEAALTTSGSMAHSPEHPGGVQLEGLCGAHDGAQHALGAVPDAARVVVDKEAEGVQHERVDREVPGGRVGAPSIAPPHMLLLHWKGRWPLASALHYTDSHPEWLVALALKSCS